MNNRGQFSIIAALLVAVVLIATAMTTYSTLRYTTTLDQPQILSAIDETNLALKKVLGFTVGYYGSVLQVTGNSSYASTLATNYLNSGLKNIGNMQPEWGASFNVTALSLSTNWFTNASYSSGLLNVTYDLTGLSISGVFYSTSCSLNVQILASSSYGTVSLKVSQDNNQPLVDLGAKNFKFYNYDFSNSTWSYVSPNLDPTVYADGTYVIDVPPGINATSSYMIQVEDTRGIIVEASSVSRYTYTFNYSNIAIAGALGQNSVAAVEMMQNGTMRWLGQNLQLTTQTFPMPPIPVKDFLVNETINGVNQKVPFQVEDWASDYRIPLGLTNNYTVFGNSQMIVFLVTTSVSQVTIWWNGSDVATQTPYAYTDLYFTNDNPANKALTNNMLTLKFTGNFAPVTATVGSTTSTANFKRVNTQQPTYGSPPAYTVYNGVVRDIITQEAEWSNGITNSPNVYSQIVITLPANVTYYTYQLRLMFLNSNQNRNINDLSLISLTSSINQAQLQTENGLQNGVPVVATTTGTDYFFNSNGTGAHHWSQFISGTTGAGIMFTDNANQQLYVFDSMAGQTTGAIMANSASQIIELDPVTSKASVAFTNALDVSWYGAVATFDGTSPIYTTNQGNPVGLWIVAEQPPTVTVTTDAAPMNIVYTPSIALSSVNGPVGGSVTVSGSGFVSSSPITVKYDGTTVANTMANSSGFILSGVTFNVLDSVAGTGHTVTATDASNNTASATFTVTPSITITSGSSGVVGSTMTVSGSGFAANSALSATYGGSPVTLGGSTSTGSTGSFAGATFTVPASIAGSKAVVFSDSATPTPNSAQAAFTVVSSISLNPTSGTPATTVTVTGTGFGATVTVTIKYDGATQTTNPSTITTGTTGSFSATFAVPVSAPGGHVVTATDVTNSPTATFTVNVGVLDHFAFSTISSPRVAGTAFQITVTAQDAYGNTVASYVSSNSLTVSSGTISPTSTGAFTGGVWTGSVTLSSSGAGIYVSTSGSGKSGQSNTFTVNPGVLDHFGFSTISSPQVAGTAFSITITAKDASGNTVTSYTGSNTLTVSAGTISPTSTTAFTAGVWTSAVTLYTTGTGITISTTGATKSGTSNGITMNAGTGRFGYQTQGSSTSNGDLENYIRGSRFTSPAYSVTAQSITAYIQVSNTHTIKAAIYTSGGTLVAGTGQVSVTTSNDGWVTFAFAAGPTLAPNTDYLLVVWGNNPSGTSSATLYHDSGGIGRYYSLTYASSWPSLVSFSSSTVGSYDYSIYCTYSIP